MLDVANKMQTEVHIVKLMFWVFFCQKLQRVFCFFKRNYNFLAIISSFGL